MNRDKLPTSSTSISETAHRLIDLSKQFLFNDGEESLELVTLQQRILMILKSFDLILIFC
jgi:hypothetical protein